MMQIKTVRYRLDDAPEFDREVNNALRNGWTLSKRGIVNPIAQSDSRYIHTMLYAELVKEVAGNGSSKENS